MGDLTALEATVALAGIIFGPASGIVLGGKLVLTGLYNRLDAADAKLDEHGKKLDRLIDGQSVNRERIAHLEGKGAA